MPRLPLDRVREIEKAEDEEDLEALDALLAQERRDHAAMGAEPGWEDVVEDRLAQVLQRAGERRKGERRRDTEFRKTVDEVFDGQTLLTLYRLISRGVFQTLDYPLSTGKEGNVFHATARDGEGVAVKIYRTNTATFRSFMTYIAGDPRFQSVRPNRRDLVHAWCQKEFKNLQRMREHGVRVPTPIAYLNNVLVMEFIGHEGTPAPLLREAPPEEPVEAFATLVGFMEATWQKAGLVHGDLSEFNVLNAGGELVVIDVAQAVLRRHPMAPELLDRDVRNVLRWFRRFGIHMTDAELKARIAPVEKKDVE